MKDLAKPFMFLALAGFFASLIAHVCGYMGIDKPFGISPWPLHVGIFVVFFPAVLASQKLSKNYPQNDMWRAALRGCPPWMLQFFYILFGYAILSFIGFAMLNAGNKSESSTIRGFSGHWLIFYYASFAMLYSYINIDEDLNRECRNGHPVQPFEKYCSECGARVDNTSK